ncbi:phosphatase PAP2 family protein [uncultured Serinicoccus sp.]|uniref:phosphatase PAP2 family protein n=1 Tax=uncultured Serinicoccus sp. TaxID=735514 RepID=UPI00261E3E30|nr:phosphatase PAP2 family protein [uncultured Serinicoccus sp.]
MTTSTRPDPAPLPRLADDPSPVGWPAGLMLLGGLGFVSVYVLAVLSTRGQSIDTGVMDAVTVTGSRHDLLSGLLPNPYLLLGLALGLGALALLRHLRTGLAVLVTVPLLVASTQVLKDVLPRPQLADPWVMANSLPSGHTGAALALALALLLLSPRRLLPAAALVGAGLSLWMGALVVLLGYHRPSDVLASALLAVGAGGLGLLVRGVRPAR